ncbi:hypothetical protein [Streptomyces sp. NPDC005799]|uniref:hypothetical protein n=1 Tax=Streptomyces sp. NPDC005799 TaxID=3154678 RepID=UPI0033C570AF
MHSSVRPDPGTVFLFGGVCGAVLPGGVLLVLVVVFLLVVVLGLAGAGFLLLGLLGQCDLCEGYGVALLSGDLSVWSTGSGHR